MSKFDNDDKSQDEDFNLAIAACLKPQTDRHHITWLGLIPLKMPFDISDEEYAIAEKERKESLKFQAKLFKETHK